MSDIHSNAQAVTNNVQTKRNMHSPGEVWLMGVSGSGQSTLADALELAL